MILLSHRFCSFGHDCVTLHFFACKKEQLALFAKVQTISSVQTENSSEMAQGASSNKRKAGDAFVPDSINSYLMGALRENFEHLKTHIQQDCAFVAAKVNSKHFTKQLLEELFRYLYLLAGSSSDGVIRSSPSYFVDQAFHCLMLDPLLYWKVCDELLNLHGKDSAEVQMRLLPHDGLGGKGDDEEPRRARYTNTLAQYKAAFGEDPLLAIWSDYSDDPVAVQAELEAQQAQVTTSKHRSSQNAVVAVASPTPPAPELSLASRIKLRITGMNGNSLALTVKYDERFSAILDRVCTHQKQSIRHHVLLTYRSMVLRGYMMPYNLNMKDGDVVGCSIPILSPEELATNATNLSNKPSAAPSTSDTGITTIAATTVAATAAIASPATTTAATAVPSIDTITDATIAAATSSSVTAMTSAATTTPITSSAPPMTRTSALPAISTANTSPSDSSTKSKLADTTVTASTAPLCNRVSTNTDSTGLNNTSSASTSVDAAARVVATAHTDTHTIVNPASAETTSSVCKGSNLSNPDSLKPPAATPPLLDLTCHCQQQY